MKIDVTNEAKNEIAKVLAEEKNKGKLLRIYIAGYGWGGPSFGLALDELKDEDIEINVDDNKFVVEDVVAENFESFTVDYSDNWLKRGFSVLPNGFPASNC